MLDRLFEFLKDQLNKRVPQIFTMMRAASLDLQGGTLLSAEQLEQLLLAVANEKLRPVCCSMLSWTVSQLCEQLEALRGLLDELHAERRAQKDKEQSERWTRYTSISIVIIAVLTAIGFATAFLGLAIIMPWLAYSAWHAYCETLDASGWPALD